MARLHQPSPACQQTGRRQRAEPAGRRRSPGKISCGRLVPGQTQCVEPRPSTGPRTAEGSLTPHHLAIVSYIREAVGRHGSPPSMHEIGQTLQLHHYPAEVSQDGSAPWCYRRTTCREQAIPYADRMEWLDGLLRGAFGGLAMETLRRRNPHGPLADTRGAAGRTHAIAHAIRAGLVAGESPEEIEERIRAAEEAGLPLTLW